MQVRAQARPTARGPLNPRLDGIYPEQDPRHSVYLRRSSSSPRVSRAPSRIVSSWFVCCPGDVTNMRPVDITVELFPEDAASLRFRMIRQQTILCATRIEAGTRLLYGGCTEIGIGYWETRKPQKPGLPVPTREQGSLKDSELDRWFSVELAEGRVPYRIKSERKRHLMGVFVKGGFDGNLATNGLTIPVDHPQQGST